MRSNVNQAVGIIAVLSVLLGLSLGQLQDKHRTIEELKGETPSFRHFEFVPATSHWESRRHRCDRMRERVGRLRAQVEQERARIEMERARLFRELEQNGIHDNIHHDRTHIIRREEQ